MSSSSFLLLASAASREIACCLSHSTYNGSEVSTCCSTGYSVYVSKGDWPVGCVSLYNLGVVHPWNKSKSSNFDHQDSMT